MVCNRVCNRPKQTGLVRFIPVQFRKEAEEKYRKTYVLRYFLVRVTRFELAAS
nr:MAG TPA: hypothetical protein [Caudoviricetes sp.]